LNRKRVGGLDVGQVANSGLEAASPTDGHCLTIRTAPIRTLNWLAVAWSLMGRADQFDLAQGRRGLREQDDNQDVERFLLPS